MCEFDPFICGVEWGGVGVGCASNVDATVMMGRGGVGVGWDVNAH